mmetsp:Transcript_89330/g.255053  ORF Transcript_89330/g.255053 Transcript_89330/m.255053 type:complete len:147 (+) Transcript_89330:414-854(+)
MGGRHEQLTGAVRYFEDQYVQDPSKEKIELLTKEYLADALNTVATDVNDIASNLNDFLDLQAEAVDSLGTSLEMANMRLRMLKQQHGAARFQHMRQDKPPPPTDARKTQAQDDAPEYNRVPLSERLNKYSAVGISLQGEAGGAASS